MRDFHISGYRIERVLGQGGMATVYLAVQENLNRPVALKVMHNLSVPGFSERFLNEGRIIAKLAHPHIITIYDIGVSDECHYISMEYLQGGDLKKRIHKGIESKLSLEYLEQLADCLAFVHEKGIVHRDIKPANVLFRSDDKLVLTDFGIAKQLQADLDLTATGATLGSPHYLSPEQAEGKSVDGRSDIYSLGIMFYEMLTGEKPYQGENYVSTVMQHLSAPIPALPSDVAQYQSLLKRMLAKKPEERFNSAKSLVQAIRFVRMKNTSLNEVQFEEETEKTPKSRHERLLAAMSSLHGKYTHEEQSEIEQQDEEVTVVRSENDLNVNEIKINKKTNILWRVLLFLAIAILIIFLFFIIYLGLQGQETTLLFEKINNIIMFG